MQVGALFPEEILISLHSNMLNHQEQVHIFQALPFSHLKLLVQMKAGLYSSKDMNLIQTLDHMILVHCMPEKMEALPIKVILLDTLRSIHS